MNTYSKLYSGDGGRSNARRAARAAGVDPELVTKYGDGFRFPLPETSPAQKPAAMGASLALGRSRKRARLRAESKAEAETATKEPAPFTPDFRFGSHQGASNAAVSAAKRLGLARDAYVVIVRYDGTGVAKYAFVPKHRADGYTISTSEAPREAPQRAADKPSRGKQRPKRSGKTEGGENKLETVRKMICARGGALMKDITAATGWLEHTARARISGIAKEHNLTIERQRILGQTTYIAKPAKEAAA